MSESPVTMLPPSAGSGFVAQQERYLKQQTENVLKGLINEIRTGSLTYESAACGLGRIAGYYDLLAEVRREQDRREEEHKTLEPFGTLTIRQPIGRGTLG